MTEIQNSKFKTDRITVIKRSNVLVIGIWDFDIVWNLSIVIWDFSGVFAVNKKNLLNAFSHLHIRSLRYVYRFWVLSFLTPMASALRVPTITTSFLPRVTAV